MMLATAQSNAQTADVRTITAFQPVRDVLNNDQLRHEWVFDGQNGQIISIVATRTTDDLDPVIELRNSAGQLLAANDNESFDSVNARIEALPIPNDDQYIIHVYREGLTAGQTTGEYELTLFIGYSIHDNAQPTTATVAVEPQQVQQFAPSMFHLTADVQMPEDTADYMLTWQLRDPAGIVWNFEHDANGNWTFSIDNNLGDNIRSNTGTSSYLPAIGEQTSLAFHRTAEKMSVMVNLQPVAELDMIPNLVITEIGSLSVASRTISAQTATIENIAITTAFYTRQPFESGAIAPSPPDERIYNYDASPTDIVRILRDLGYASSPTETSGLQSDIISTFIYNDETSFNAYPLLVRPFRNFVVSFGARIEGGVESSACGIIVRQASSSTFATLLFRPDRGVYVLQYIDGVLQEGGLASIEAAVLPGNEDVNYFMMVVQDDQAQVFVNGRRIGEVTLLDVAGLTLSHLALDDEVPTYCQLDNLWLWSLE